MSDVMQAVQKDAPVMVAWNNYKSCDEFKNTRKWALHEEHVEGSLWAAFYAGFFACAVDRVNTDGQQQPTSDDVMAALLFCLWHHQGGNSKIGQPIRFALGIGRDEPLTDVQLAIAERVQSALCASHSAVKVQACRTEDRAMLATDAGKELLTKAAAALSAPHSASQLDGVPIHESLQSLGYNLKKFSAEAKRVLGMDESQPDTVPVPIQTLHVSLQVLTFLKAVLIGHGYQKDSSSIHQLEIAYSMLKLAKEMK